MFIPEEMNEVSMNQDWTHQSAYPPLGFYPFADCALGNGDTHGLYWPVGRENAAPIVAETWHDSWRVQPNFSSLKAFVNARRMQESEDEDDEDNDYLEPPTIDEDGESPRACLEAAKEQLKVQEIDAAIKLLTTAVAVLPEYTDALTLLWSQYVRTGRETEALQTAMQAVICPPSFGELAKRPLAWLRSQDEKPALRDDPIWLARHKLRFVYGGTKQNDDYPSLLQAIKAYIEQSQIIKAVVLMQTYAELMSSETVSFQERYQFDRRQFANWQLEVSALLPHGPRRVTF